MDFQSALNLYVDIIKDCVPLVFIVNVGQLLVNMIISAGFGGRLKTKINI